MSKKRNDFVLWGCHPSYSNGTPIKICIGTQRNCNAEKMHREREDASRWTNLEVRESEVPRR